MTALDTIEKVSAAHKPSGRLGRWINPWLAVLRLAQYDAVRHRARTILAVLLVVLPIAALIGGTVLTQSAVPSRDLALAGIPDGVQAEVTATAVSQTGMPFAQIPEGAPGPWMDDTSQVPAGLAELGAVLPAGNQLQQYWNSPQLLITNGLDLTAGDDAKAGAGVIENVDLASITTATLQEADGHTLAFLMPKLASGTAPADTSDIVVSSALAKQLGISEGDVIAAVAAPFNGMMSTNGRIGDAVQDAQRGYRVSGVVDSDSSQAWALEGWISAMATKSPAGVDGHWLVVGSEPVTWEQAKELNKLQAFAVSRHVLENYPSAGELYPVPANPVEVLGRIAALAVTGLVGTMLVLFLVTPAFAVSTEQSRRMLGLAAATGATPRDMKRIVTAQGLVVGLAGGILGAVLGSLAGIIAREAIEEGPTQFPWWILPLGIAIAVVLGFVATWLPARTASRMAPVDALKNRPTTHQRSSQSHIRRRLAGFTGPLLLLAGVACAVLSLTLPLPEIVISAENSGRTGRGGMAVLLVVLGLLLVVAGLLLSLKSLVNLAGRLSWRLPMLPRLALRDAVDHSSRFLPAAAGILVSVLAASFLAVTIGSLVVNDRDTSGSMVAGSSFVVGPNVPVSASFDRLVINDAISTLGKDFPVAAHHPIFTTPSDGPLYLAAVMPESRSCPEGEGPDTASSVQMGVPLDCVSDQIKYRPGMSVAWWVGTAIYIMDADALRSSGRPGAEAAAKVLDAGGAVVNNAAMLSEKGTVRIASSTDRFPDTKNAQNTTVVPGAFMRGFTPYLTISPETAASFAIENPEYVGEFVAAAKGTTPSELAQASALIKADNNLVKVGRESFPYPWGEMGMLIPLALLAALAVAATTISILLARTQSVRDAATMHAIGATPRFLRRFTIVQACVVLGAGVPLGALTGVGLGAFLIAWNRRTGGAGGTGAWLETVPLWSVQGVLVLSVVGAGLLTAFIIGRPPKEIWRRSLD
ncbi:ABC transporter permease [Arthrobacter sp. TMP15]|uniref:ABC transporter permease n=1 Tax=Arthrobacter sp. TMP15 TaxID=3140789 RepID=UPI0031BA0CEA